MPSISKIRFTNVIYEDGMKRYNDDIFLFDGQNGAVLLENGGGKTVFIQTALQAVLPHTDLGDRKLKQTLKLDEGPAHIAIEWIIQDKPRHYAVTAVSLFSKNNQLDSVKFAFDYSEQQDHRLETLPFTQETADGTRVSSRQELLDHYAYLNRQFPNRAKTFQTIREYQAHIEETYQLITNEWKSLLTVNSGEGNVEKFFDHCHTSQALFDRLLIPTVESVLEDHGFVETFEESRDNFKQYKRLKEVIHENQGILEELNTYMNHHHELNEQEQAFTGEKTRLKGLSEAADGDEKQHQEALTALDREWSDFEAEEKRHLLQSDSLQISRQEEAFQEADRLLTELTEEAVLLEEKWKEAKRRDASLRLAGKKQELSEAKASRSSAAEQLAAQETDEELTDLEERLTAVKAELKGYFEALEKAIHDDMAMQTRRLEELSQERRQKEDEKEKHSVKREESAREAAEISGEIRSITSQMQKLKGELLSNEQTESVEGLMKSWMTKQADLDEEKIRLSETGRRLEQEQADMTTEMNRLKEALADRRVSLRQRETEQEQMDQEHERVRHELTAAKHAWRGLTSIYDQDAKLDNQLTAEISCSSRLRDDKRRSERIQRRLFDDYGGQDLFFADPEMAGLFKQWQNQWPVLETGFSYLEMIGESLSEHVTRYPYWAATLITTADEKGRLEAKLHDVSDKLLYPVFVLSTDEVKTVLQGAANDSMAEETVVIPAHWTDNLDPGQFNAWKERIEETAQKAEEAVKEQEELLRYWEDLQGTLQAFLMRYPFESWQNLNEQITSHQQEERQLVKAIRQQEQKQDDLKLQIRRHHERQNQVAEAYADVSSRLVKGQEYRQLKRRMTERDVEKKRFDDEVASAEMAIQRLLRQIQGIMIDEDEAKGAISNLKSRLTVEVWHDPAFKVAEPVASLPASRSKAMLDETLRELQLEELRMTRSHDAIRLQLSHAEKDVARLEKDIREIRSEDDLLDEEMDFPFDGGEQITLWQKWKKQCHSELDALGQRVRKQEKQADRLKWKLEELMTAFQTAFPERTVYRFEGDLDDAAKQLAAEAKSLKDRREALADAFTRLKREGDELEKVQTQLETFDAIYGFSDPALQAEPLTEEEHRAFTYQRLKQVETQYKRLQHQGEEVKLAWKRVNHAKAKFLGFIRENVQDQRLRHRAEEGVLKKETYSDMLAFETYMEKSLRQAIKIAEANIQSQGKQVETFIAHVHQHLRKLAAELQSIPEKTRVKTGEQWKTIFTFGIPDWAEEEGLERIREHFDWIMNELEKEAYKDSDGQDNTAKMRQSLETWLHAKQLLRRVINEKSLKVSCRKVKNNNDITSRSYSWEESNRWSGGEKWSKNMTLFLGIQNYVAEKKQPITIDGGGRRSRTVILDNPFGQASSDHVLSPVFFVAEKLGFQILTLTAHTEGKFLGDYFPVIYSCRLRSAAGTDKQMVDKEKKIQYAYFKDHDPLSLERLGETQQGTLW
ncbi:coiled-coil domain-containing protein [Salisediminibacterium beveridgei]|uniref:Chromosome Segregation ATPase-Like Protein n=1 Tax=Salisediminibacterium beveridgei TaxID=632773 RepID=A0A1D7QS14_9BACI|nr:hypothetical protein [Salisediminibacterium beveridgei]AOM81800.1 Chromosome Segregation ATPase-Like Protein [Salisediminibacterium beveridgei]